MKAYNGMQGLGDNIYQRAFLPVDEDVYLVTAWPQLYSDMPNVKPVKSPTTLRTQKKNADIQRQWSAMPSRANPVQIQYWDMGPPRGMEKAFQRAPRALTLPSFGGRIIHGKYIIVRPNTVRTEWVAESRAPRNEYLHIAVRAAMLAGYSVVSVADVDGVAERYLGEPTYADIRYDNGQLGINGLMRFIEHADGVIGGIGWLLPAAMAYKTPALIVAGGWGAYNHPSMLVDNRLGQNRITWAMPDNMCMCKTARHDCDKTIRDFDQIAARWVSSMAG